MGKQLLPMLDFSLLLFFLPRKGLAEALMCFQCTVFHTKGICLYKEGSCETENDQTRVLWTASVALSCFQCELLNSEGICEKGESTCETERDQQCAMVKVSTGARIQYMIQECSNLCINQTFTERYITVKYTCCNNTSFCNQP